MTVRPFTRTRARDLLASGLLVLLGVGCAPGDGEQEGLPSRVVLLGIDGATWTVMGPMLREGLLPNFARLIREGAHDPTFDTLDSTHSPVVWTTIATGRHERDHGIRWFVEQLDTGEVIPISSSGRRVPAIWEIASRRGRSVGVLNWWASWPLDPIEDGYLVSDHANPALSEAIGHIERFGRRPFADLPALGRAYTPEDLAPLLDRMWISEAAFPYDALRQTGGFRDEQMAAMREAPWTSNGPYSILKRFHAADEPIFRAGVRLYRERPVDLQDDLRERAGSAAARGVGSRGAGRVRAQAAAPGTRSRDRPERVPHARPHARRASCGARVRHLADRVLGPRCRGVTGCAEVQPQGKARRAFDPGPRVSSSCAVRVSSLGASSAVAIPAT